MNTAQSFRELYEPIVGTSDAHRDNPAVTPRKQMERTIKLQETFEELKTDLLEEVMMMDSRVTKPAIEAKDFLQPIRKTIKKRENKRLDWERYIDKVNKASTKMRRTDKENAALAKAEQDQARAGVVSASHSLWYTNCQGSMFLPAISSAVVAYQGSIHALLWRFVGHGFMC